MKIFFLGGTFDPPHLGHFSIAKRCLEHKDCDQFVFVPCKQNPLKDKPYFSAFNRAFMLEIMYQMSNFRDFKDKVWVDLFEADSKSRVNYTIDTINYLLQEYNPSDLYMVIGQDLLKSVESWKDWDKIKELVKIVCINRPGYKYQTNIDISLKFDDISLDIESTFIRNKIMTKDWESLEEMVPWQVIDYIERIKQ
tara:strand:- start:211 stop:795 length:585 start_codon:yes stop_codon:yes gene_type:complete